MKKIQCHDQLSVIQPPSEGADDGPRGYPHAVDRRSHAYLLDREGFDEDGLGQRLQGAPSDALEDTEDDEALQVPGEPAKKRAYGEDGHGKHEVDLPPEETAEPPRHGDDDGVGHEIGGHGPRRLIDACR